MTWYVPCLSQVPMLALVLEFPSRSEVLKNVREKMCQKWVRFSCLSVQNRISILFQYPLLYTLDYIFSNVVTIAWLLVIIFSSLGNPILFHVFFYFLYFCWKSSEKVTNFSVFTRFKRNGKKMHKNKIYIRIRHIKISENMIFHPFWVTSIFW